MNTPSIEERVKNMGEEIQGMYFEAGARIGVHHWHILCEKLTTALSQVRQEGYKDGAGSRQGEIDFLRHEAYGDALTTEGK